MSNLNIVRVKQLLNAENNVDPFNVLMGLDYVPQPMSINAYCAQASKSIADIELCRFEIEHGCYKDLGVTFDEFKFVAIRAAQ